MIIVFESRTGNTKTIADKLAEAVQAQGVDVEVKRGRECEAADLEQVDAVAMGGATYHHDLIPSMKEFLFKTEKADLEGKPGLAFGSFGWSGDAIDIIQDTMIHLHKMDVIKPPLKVNAWKPESDLAEIGELAKRIADKLK